MTSSTKYGIIITQEDIIVNVKSEGETMDKKALEARREYYRKWHKQNPGKQKEYQERYWKRKAEAMNADGEKGSREGNAVGI